MSAPAIQPAVLQKKQLQLYSGAFHISPGHARGENCWLVARRLYLLFRLGGAQTQREIRQFSRDARERARALGFPPASTQRFPEGPECKADLSVLLITSPLNAHYPRRTW